MDEKVLEVIQVIEEDALVELSAFGFVFHRKELESERAWKELVDELESA